MLHKKHLCTVHVEPLSSLCNFTRLPKKEIITSDVAYVFLNNQPHLLILSNHRSALFNHDEEDDFYSEQKWIDKEGAIFIALINLSTNLNFYSFITTHEGTYHNYDKSIFSDPLAFNKTNVNFVKNDLSKKINSRLLTSGVNFESHIEILNIEYLNSLIQRKNQVLLRCLYYYAKACALITSRMTIEEATALQLFSLDGILKLLMHKYSIKKVADLFVYIKKNHGVMYIDYLNDLYNERTIYVHPETEALGEYWCPPWDADLCIETIYILKSFILLYLTDVWYEQHPI